MLKALGKGREETMIAVTQNQLDTVLATLREVGYYGLDDQDRKIADAFDNGTLRILPQQNRKFVELD